MSAVDGTPLVEVIDAIVPDGAGYDDVQPPHVDDLDDVSESERFEVWVAHKRRHRLEEVSTAFRDTVSRSAEERFSDGWTPDDVDEWRVEWFRRSLDLFCREPLLVDPLREAAEVVDEVAEKSREAYPRVTDE
ncbi:hypothetical protein GCM10008995_29200 [Halobellus salinus]|uniref:Uncharacterized protein n=1 Tax=Halobellus salinus TaxID=931585 RepID=A0A830EEV4_9EURY|nr:hypothetical protein [Halobellus salinus]GGJ17585.1 hypothetical protein GCM10008995_29200 [Halobellus salinus]SMP35406.1 hypothetical protein SAMN06265347_13012 [Halobellus salinus]